jgi:hypothetical protein
MAIGQGGASKGRHRLPGRAFCSCSPKRNVSPSSGHTLGSSLINNAPALGRAQFGNNRKSDGLSTIGILGRLGSLLNRHWQIALGCESKAQGNRAWFRYGLRPSGIVSERRGRNA